MAAQHHYQMKIRIHMTINTSVRKYQRPGKGISPVKSLERIIAISSRGEDKKMFTQNGFGGSLAPILLEILEIPSHEICTDPTLYMFQSHSSVTKCCKWNSGGMHVKPISQYQGGPFLSHNPLLCIYGKCSAITNMFFNATQFLKVDFMGN